MRVYPSLFKSFAKNDYKNCLNQTLHTTFHFQQFQARGHRVYQLKPKYKYQIQNMIKLTNNAIPQMLTKAAGKHQNYIVQCSKFKVIQEIMRMDLFDGTNKTKAIVFLNAENMDIRQVAKPYGEAGKYVIEINDYTTYTQNEQLFIQIHRFTPVQPPKTRSDVSSVDTSTRKQVKVEFVNQKSQKKSGPISIVKSQYKTPNRLSTMPQTIQTPDQNDLKNFQKIADLFTDMPGWQIIVRVIEKSYRQFNNKSGKLTKIFSMTLTDRTGMKIEGVMFGDNAKEYHDLIKVNGVYRVSRGQIREDNFKQNRGDKFSRYSINLTKNSIFIPIKDIPQIPRANNSCIELKDLIKGWNFQQHFDIVGILINIGEDRIIEKDGRSLFKKNLILGDPQTLKCIQVVIWNQNLVIDPNWLNRTVLFKNFKLHSFRDTLAINSFFKSQIRLQNNHKFNQYEGKYTEKDYQNIEMGENNDKNQELKDKYPKTIRQLQNEISLSNGSQPIYSDLQVYITHMSFKGKWAYEACNNTKCKKSAEAYTKCLNCGHYNDNTNRRFILPIQITDFTGSLWTTAFDQLVREIFKGNEYLTNLTQDELKQEGQKHLYQQFKIKISSKKEPEGNFKHNVVGKVNEMSIEKSAISNVQRIKKFLDY